METNHTIEGALRQWLAVHAIGKRPRTVHFNTEIVCTIRKHLDCSKSSDSLSKDEVFDLGMKLGHYCPSRWNASVSVLRYISPHAAELPKRPLRMRQFSPPSQLQFTAFLLECDRSSRSKAGLIVRFLAWTGLRISEAMALTWSNVYPDRIEVPASAAKSGKRRAIDLLPGTEGVLQSLRALDSGGYVLPRQNARRAIAHASRAAGLPHMSHHCFRHLFATRCIEAGVDVATIATWMGHQDGGTLLLKTYVHLSDDHRRAMAQRVRIAA